VIIPSPRSQRRARIEIIPLIDIVFFLLATFVMVSLSMVKNQGVPVELPKASTGSKQASDSNYTAITVTTKGDIFFNKTKVTEKELTARLKELKARQSDPIILLNGDDKAYLGKAIYVLDEARKLGIKKVALQTKQPEA
jgi:biopolymer transport protein ExbD